MGAAFLSSLVWCSMILRYDAPRLAALTLVAPVFGVLFGLILPGKDAGHDLMGGLVCISIGLWLVKRNGWRLRHG